MQTPRIHMNDQVRNNVKDIMAHTQHPESQGSLISTWMGILMMLLLVLSD